MRFRVSTLGTLVLALVLVSGAAARPMHHPGFHRPFFHPHAGGRVFIGGSVFFDPFLYPYYPYYPVSYPYPVYGYPPPPPEEEASGPPPGPGEEQRSAMEDATRRANYGLVQLRGVPDGASVDLDGRFWLTADALDGRWLALPEGSTRSPCAHAASSPLSTTST